jgi:hypothetical protein
LAGFSPWRINMIFVGAMGSLLLDAHRRLL